MDIQQYKSDVLSIKNVLYRFAFRFLNDDQEAQDVVQEVLIKAWEKRQSLLEVKNVKAWCLVVTKNIALNRLRGKRDNMVDMQQYLNLKSKGKDPYPCFLDSNIAACPPYCLVFREVC